MVVRLKEEQHILFAYGSLIEPEVQEMLFGKKLDNKGKAILENWQKYNHEDYPFISPLDGARVEGVLFVLTHQQLGIADKWEEIPVEYQRELLLVDLGQGMTQQAWVYTKRKKYLK